MSTAIDELTASIDADLSIASDLDEKTLEAVLRRASEKYYTTGNPVLNDNAFDILKDRLAEINPRNAFLNAVGTEAVPERKVRTKLPFPMFSMDKLKPGMEKALAAWFAKYDSENYVISSKLDGTSGMLVWSRSDQTSSGWMLNLYCRGDARGGFEINRLIPYVVPEALQRGPPRDAAFARASVIAVRGEIIVSKKDFAKLVASGSQFANARSLTNGTVNRIKPDPTIARYLRFVSYEVVEPRLSKTNQMSALESSGLEVVQHEEAHSLDERSLIDTYTRFIQTSPYDIDGIIIEDDGPHPLSTSSNPKYAFAFKMPLEGQSANVHVIEVEWRASKNGLLKPRVRYEPVQLDGVMLQMATGFNARYIRDNGIGPGATIEVARSGQVIPTIMKVIHPVEPQMPGVPYIWNENGVEVLLDGAASREVIQRRLTHFMKSMLIVGISEGVVAKLYDAGFTTIRSYLQATPERLMSVPGFQSASAKKLVGSIREKTRNAPPARAMTASNAFGQGFGERRITAALDGLVGVDLDDRDEVLTKLLETPGFSDITAIGFADGLAEFAEFMHANPELTLARYVQPRKAASDAKLAGKVFVFTGFRDAALKQKIESLGGAVVDAISAKVSFVIAKDAAENSIKTRKARDLGIPIVGRDDIDV